MKWSSWGEKETTGHAGMDHAHKKLVGLINQLADCMENNKPKEFCSNTLDQFIELTSAHFLAEEHLMDRYQYPEAQEHKALHAKLVADVLAFKASYDSSDAVESMTLLVVLDSWLDRDIMTADKALANFVAAAGPQTQPEQAQAR
jgi:hemerythrin-like metal-binding protein